MSTIYVCLFSNGVIKVGRSVNPKTRISGHAARVACVGVELVGHRIFECFGNSVIAECKLINRCASHASGRQHREWFFGLVFSDVCQWAEHEAAQFHEKIISFTKERAGTRDIAARIESRRYECRWDGDRHYWVDATPHLPHWPESYVMRWDLRPNWHDIWPELIDHPCALLFAPVHPHRTGPPSFFEWVKSWPIGIDAQSLPVGINERLVKIESREAVTRKDLRPNDWHLIWPELAEKAA